MSAQDSTRIRCGMFQVGACSAVGERCRFSPNLSLLAELSSEAMLRVWNLVACWMSRFGTSTSMVTRSRAGSMAWPRPVRPWCDVLRVSLGPAKHQALSGYCPLLAASLSWTPCHDSWRLAYAAGVPPAATCTWRPGTRRSPSGWTVLEPPRSHQAGPRGLGLRFRWCWHT